MNTAALEWFTHEERLAHLELLRQCMRSNQINARVGGRVKALALARQIFAVRLYRQLQGRVMGGPIGSTQAAVRRYFNIQAGSRG